MNKHKLVEKDYILSTDIGGTNSNFALFEINSKKFSLINSIEMKTNEIKDFNKVFDKVLKVFLSHTLEITCIGIAAAGPVEDNKCTLINASLEIDGNYINKKYNIPCFVINDFIALSYAIPILEKDKDYIEIYSPEKKKKSKIQCVIGAGTGLGISALITQEENISAIASEGGHSDFAPFSAETAKLWNYFFKKFKRSPFIEDFLSGSGLSIIYNYYSKKNKPTSAETIFKNFETDKKANKTIKLFLRIYASAIKNAALTLLPFGGIYIAGGIAAKNYKFFTNKKLFIKHLHTNNNEKLNSILKTIPIYLIKDYSMSLHGTANAAIQVAHKNWKLEYFT